ISFLNALNPIAGFVGSVFFIYASLSIRSLFDESLPTSQFLKKGKLQEARISLSRIVGRDTQNLNEDEIVRATVETIAESTVDGIIAPLFFAALGGAPLVIAYKSISTMDSLFGYKNKKYIDFGWAAARLDDLANWLPARLAIPIIAMGAALCGGDGMRACTIGYRDGNKHPSPNAGIPEATMAGALGIQLGGISYYSGVENAKPLLGDSVKRLHIPDIEQSQKIMFASSCIALVFISSLCQLSNYFGIII
ncbi:MAG: cobalamin biosynthesis protein CobD, partial [Nitrospinae bacterium]|nr:cobalamin biosynthesis protein CobD [Nitrospinota bacterium]